MTSNVGSQWISEAASQNQEAVREHVMGAMRQQFRPEFLNRIDEIIMFHALTREHLGRIVDIQVRYLQNLLKTKNIGLELTDAARVALAQEGYDPVYGARPLKRTIQKRIQDPLAMELLQGTFREGDTVRVDHEGQRYVFDRAAIEMQVAT